VGGGIEATRWGFFLKETTRSFLGTSEETSRTLRPPPARAHTSSRAHAMLARAAATAARAVPARAARLARAFWSGLSRALSCARRLLHVGRRAGAGSARGGPARASSGALGADAAEDTALGYGLARWERERRRDPMSDARLRELGLCSRESRHSTEVVFVNGLRDERARIYWVDYRGKPTRYKTLAPGERHRQQTFVTHPWTFTTVPDDDASDPERAAAGPRRLVVQGSPVYFPPPPPAAASQSRTTSNATGPRGVDGDEEDPSESVAVAVVERPAERAWSHESHARFPAFFKDVARAFVLSHARLRRGDDDDRGAAFASDDETEPNRNRTEPTEPSAPSSSNKPDASARTARAPRWGGTRRSPRLAERRRREAAAGGVRGGGVREAAADARDDAPAPLEEEGSAAARGSGGRESGARSSPSSGARSSPSSPPSGGIPGPSRGRGRPATLGDLPPELAHYVVRLAAPTCAVYVPVEDAVRAALDAEEAMRRANRDEGEAAIG